MKVLPAVLEVGLCARKDLLEAYKKGGASFPLLGHMELEEAAGIWGVAGSGCRGGSGVEGGGDGLGGCGKDAGGVGAGEGCWCRSGSQLCGGGERGRTEGCW